MSKKISKKEQKKDEKNEKNDVEIKKESDEKKNEFTGVTLKEMQIALDIGAKLILWNNKEYVDIRRYERGFPTKRGIMMERNVFKKLQEIDFNNLERTKDVKNEGDKYAKEIKSVFINENIKVSLLLYKEKEYVDIRKYYNNYPTKKGLRVYKATFLKIVELDFEKF